MITTGIIGHRHIGIGSHLSGGQRSGDRPLSPVPIGEINIGSIKTIIDNLSIVIRIDCPWNQLIGNITRVGINPDSQSITILIARNGGIKIKAIRADNILKVA